LEKAWGYDRHTLHAHGRHNILFCASFAPSHYLNLTDHIIVRAALEQTLGSDEWMLVPDPDIVSMLLEHYREHSGKPVNILTV
jgi:hypothetical protein